MKAKKKPLEQIPVADLGISAGNTLTEIAFEPPQQRQKGIMVADVPALVAALKDKGLL
jgi:electron transfer flavoprotein beta subunit